MHVDELVEHWTVLDEERGLIAGKRGATRLGFAILLKFYTRHGRFPRGRSELAGEVVEHVAKQVQVPASELGLYEWSGSTIEYHRSQIRTHLEFRVCTTADADKVTVWLAENVAHAERRPERVREELLKHLRQERIEPPTPGRVSRIVASALHNAEVTWSARIASRLGPAVTQRICALVGIDDDTDDGDGAEAGVTRAAGQVAEGAAAEDDDASSVLALIKSAPGNVSLESMMTEIRKLEAVRSIGLPEGVFADVAPKVLAAWRARAAVEAPSHLRTHPRELTVLLLAALVCEREREITGGVADRDRASDQGAGRQQGDQGADQRVQAGDREGEHPVPGRRRRAGASRRSGPGGHLPCRHRRGADAEGPGAGVQDQGPGLPHHGADHAARLLHQPLPARVDRTAGHLGVGPQGVSERKLAVAADPDHGLVEMRALTRFSYSRRALRWAGTVGVPWPPSRGRQRARIWRWIAWVVLTRRV
jgi:hypothetical protein